LPVVSLCRFPATRVRNLTPVLCGCATLTAAKIIGEPADVERFRPRHAYARTAAPPRSRFWSGNLECHRLSRIGNRQLNTASHRIAITQARHHSPAREFLQRRRAGGDTNTESIRALKNGSDVVYRVLPADAARTAPLAAITAAA
jgi:transposase